MSYIVMIDPGINEKSETHAKNLGDIVISRAIFSRLTEMFPGIEIKRIPSHYKISKRDRYSIANADKVFVAGTNLLSSDFHKFNPPFGPTTLRHLLRGNINNVILFGVGWGYGYGEPLTKLTKYFYTRVILSRNNIHSVRDQYSQTMLKDIIKVNNTNCPTMWGLNGIPLDLNNAQTKIDTCLFTLTDYLKDYGQDNDLIDFLLKKFNRVVFFPQGAWDLQYINLLPAYVKNKKRIEVLSHSIVDYDDFVETQTFLYIGTRLHGGVRCLQAHKPAYIISIDNRTSEVAKDTGLASSERGDLKSIDRWIKGRSSYGELRLNLVGIDSFLNAYK